MVQQAAKNRTFVISVWVATIALVAAAVVRWYGVRLRDGHLDKYELFPLLGLLAFTLMWSHYVSGAVRQYMGVPKEVLHIYFETTAWAVLALILLHPGILWYNLWADGFGLPPASYLSVFTEPMSRVALILGSLSLFIFLAFELRRRYREKRWWRFVEYANVAAMFAIFYHALTLGGEVAYGWFRVLWFCYGIWLLIAIVYTYSHKWRKVENE